MRQGDKAGTAETPRSYLRPEGMGNCLKGEASIGMHRDFTIEFGWGSLGMESENGKYHRSYS